MANNSRTTNSLRNMATGLGGQLFLTLLKFVTRTFFIHALGKSYLGINGLFANILSMLSLTELGLDTAINFRLYKPIVDHDIKRLRLLMKFFRQAYFVIGCVILAIGLCLIPLLPHLIKDYDSVAALNLNAGVIFCLYLSESVCSYLFFAYRAAIVRAAQKTYVLDLVEFAVTLLTNFVQIILLITVHSFVAYTVVMTISVIVKNAVNAVVAKRMFPEVFQNESENLPKEEIVGLFKDCGATFVFKVSAVVVLSTDNLVLSKFIGLAMVGTYSNYLLFYTTIRTFLGKMFTAIRASVGNFYATETIARSYFFFEVINFMTALLYGTACVGVAVMGDEVVQTWLGESYVIPQPFSVLLGIEILFYGLKVNLNMIRNITGAFRQMWFRPVLGAIINIVVSVILVQKYSIYGVVVGTIVADLTTNFLVDPAIIHEYSFKKYKSVWVYYRRNVTYLLLLAAVGAADYFLCKWIVPGAGMISILIHLVICGCSVPAVFLALYCKTEIGVYLIGKGRSFAKKAKRKIMKKIK